MQFIIVLLSVIIVSMGFGLHSLKNNLDRSEQNYERITRHLDYKTGGTTMSGEIVNYQLRTFDSGKTWYAVEFDDDWGITILGEAEEVYPGLLAHLGAWDRMIEHVHQRGPLSLVDKNDIELLRDVGFEVNEHR